ncbi:MAG: hypothetical protein V4681_03275 [Patescibacteria group bacterium]
MEPLLIQVGWEYFLGVMLALITVAWYSSGRFTKLETSMEWVRETLGELKVNADNARTPVFAAHSPVNLNALGETWLVESGLKEYIDARTTDFVGFCKEKRDTNPYEVQKHVFQLMDTYLFDQAFDDKLKKFAYEKGTSMAVIRRMAGIYIRNLCLEDFGMNRDDIDIHDPERVNE